jgi:hypothetical protein
MCVPEHHTGEHLAHALINILDQIEITEKVRDIYTIYNSVINLFTLTVYP